MATRDEVLRFLIETKGADQLQALVREILDIGQAGDQSEAQLKGLLDQVANSDRLAAAAARYREVGRAVLETGRELASAQAKVKAFADSLGDSPTAKQTAELERLRREVKQVAADYDAQRTRLVAYRAEVLQLGGSVTSLGASERAAAEARRGSVQSVEALAASLRQQAADAQQAAADRIVAEKAAQQAAVDAAAQAREAARVQTEAARAAVQASKQRQAQLQSDAKELERTRMAAEKAAVAEVKAAAVREKALRDGSAALDQYAKKQAAASAQTDRLEQRTGLLSRTMAGLRNVLATVSTYLGMRAAVEGVKNILGLSAASENLRRSFSQLFGSVEAGDAAFASIRKLAKDTGQDFAETAELAKTLKAFGIDPLSGSLRGLIDENVALGGTYDRLKGIVLALGQVQVKQKLQGEEVLQLAERGIPVWDLLAKATGKNVLELQKLSEQGKLGRKELALLIEEIGKTYQGAAAQGLTGLSGLFAQAKDRLNDFLRLIGESGVVDFFKRSLQSLNAEVDRLAANGKLKEYATDIATAITTTASAIKNAVVFLVEYGRQIVIVGAALASLKFASFLTGIAQATLGWVRFGAAAKQAGNDAAATSGRLGGLRAALSSLPTKLAISVAFIAADKAQRIIRDLANDVLEFNRVAEAKAATEARLRSINQELAAQYAATAAGLERYRDVAKLTYTDLSVLTRSELAGYRELLSGQEQYLQALTKQQVRQVELGQATQAELSATIAKLRETQVALQAYDDALKTLSIDGLSASVRQVIKDLQGIQDSSDAAKSKFGEMFKAFSQTTDTSPLRDHALAIARISTESAAAGRNIRSGLSEALREVSGRELLRFQTAAQDAFRFYEVGADSAAAVLESTLLAGMQKLGVQAENMGLQFTESGRDTIATFQAIAANAVATGEQIQSAFVAAVRAAATSGELEALGAALQDAFDRGRIGLAEFENSTLALNQRMRDLAASVDPLRQAFEALGITSRASMEAARDTAAEAFAAIEAGAQRGEASIQDVRAAFEAYAQKALEAAAGSTEWEREQVKSALRVKGEMIGATEALERLGLAGEEAGRKAADGIGVAGGALDQLRDRADEAAGSVADLGDEADGVAGALSSAADQAYRAADANDALADSGRRVSAEYADALRNIAETGGDWVEQQNLLAEALERQQVAAGRRIRQLDEELARYDPLTKYLEQARQDYENLDEATLRSLAEREQRLDQARKRAKEEADREERSQAESSARRAQDHADELRRQDELDARAAARDEAARRREAPAGGAARRVEVVLIVKNEQTTAPPLGLLADDLRRIADQVTDMVMREIELAARSSV